MWTSSELPAVRPSSLLSASLRGRPPSGGPGIGGRAVALSLGLIGFCGLLALPRAAGAVPCSGVPNPVVVAATPSSTALVQAVARVLQLSDPKPLTVVWQTVASCAGVEAVALDTQPASCGPGACLTGKALFWTTDPRDTAPKACDLDAGGTHVDLALSDVFPATCPSFVGHAPSGILDTTGPVAAYGATMNKNAPESAMQAAEGHFVFGAGKAAGVKPWLNDTTIYILGDKDAGQLLLAPRIKLAVGKWQGKLLTSSDDLLSNLSGDTTGSAVGILPTSISDVNRSDVRVLAFQALGQHGAFYPDRRSTSFEKQNVRDGHYPLWGYLHMILRADPVQPTQPKSAVGSRLSQILLARQQVGGQDVLPMQISAGLIPQCAMYVTRSDDSSPISIYSPPDPCHCYFEKNVTSGVLGCMACPDGNTCALGKHCRRYFCEVN